MIRPGNFQISPGVSDTLNCCRWVAALLVMIGHLRDFLFVGYDQIQGAGLPAKAFYFITGFGHHAVMIFFVMSGFLVGGRVLEQYLNHSFSWRKYIIDRSTRIYIVFMAALILGGSLDYTGLKAFNPLGLYDRSHAYPFSCDLANRDVSQSLEVKTLLGNMMMLQTISVSVFGSNGPLWSLAFECWYYLLFPWLLMILFSKGVWLKILGALASIGIITLLPFSAISYFGIWLMGVMARTIVLPRVFEKRFLFILFVIVICAMRAFGSDSLYLDYALGIAFALFIGAVHGDGAGGRKVNHLLSRANAFLAGFSYSLYVLHFPFILFGISAMNAIFGFAIGRQPTFQNILLFMVMVLVTYFYALLVSRWTENKTGVVRGALYLKYVPPQTVTRG